MSTIQNRPERASGAAGDNQVDAGGVPQCLLIGPGQGGDHEVVGLGHVETHVGQRLVLLSGEALGPALGGRRASVGPDTLPAAAWFTRPVGRALIEHGAPIRG